MVSESLQLRRVVFTVIRWNVYLDDDSRQTQIHRRHQLVHADKPLKQAINHKARLDFRGVEDRESVWVGIKEMQYPGFFCFVFLTKNEVVWYMGLDYSAGVGFWYPHVSIWNSEASLAHRLPWNPASCLCLFSFQTVWPIWYCYRRWVTNCPCPDLRSDLWSNMEKSSKVSFGRNILSFHFSNFNKTM